MEKGSPLLQEACQIIATSPLVLIVAPHSVHISALALLKMAIHAKSGGNLEVMGMMQGKIQGDAFIVLDAFALPVEGTETRVNAQEEAYEFMVAYNHASKVRLCSTRHAPSPHLPNAANKTARKRGWLVPQPPWLRLLVVWY